MTTLFIDRRGAELDAEGGRVVVRIAGERSATVPLRPLERVVIGPSAHISTRLLAELWRNGTALLCLSSSRRLPEVRIPGRSTADATLRLAQFALLSDEPKRMVLSRDIVGGKLEAQEQVVAHLLGANGKNPMLLEAQRRLAAAIARLRGPQVPPRSTMRGVEGAVAIPYFAALASVYPDELGFGGRNRRPPRDPVNACLSLGYTLLHTEALREAAIVGLDPAIGIFHDLEAGRDSLACDLAEPCRPLIDLWIWNLFRRGEVRLESFAISKAGCKLNKSARQAFYAAYENSGEPWRSRLRAIAQGVARRLTADETAKGAGFPPLLEPPRYPDDEATDLAHRL